MTRPRGKAILRQSSPLPVWASILWRVVAVLTLVGIAVGVHWFDRAGLRDTYDGQVSFVDVIYFTMISITTTGYGDIAPVSERARLFDALIVTPIRVFVVLLFIGTTYQFVLRRSWERWRMALLQQKLTGHIIVAGFGRTGAEAVDELIARGEEPRRIVVIDPLAANIARAQKLGCIVLEADATRDATLTDVRIATARALIVATGRDDTSILVTLTARHLAPDVPISVIVKTEDNEFPARAAGATTVINPVSFAGLLLAGSCRGPHIADYLLDLASIGGTVALAQRPVAEHEIGQPLSAITTGIGLRVYRGGGAAPLDSVEARHLERGDMIVEVVKR
ncbi:potassium transporter TrkA [Sphingomonas sp. Leaf407]|uniref:potassium channel family protein n=1 Tax=unclassified Sphingomonas TaxID=196159 RepID=UPI0006FC1B33|nr:MULTISPECIES: potassium channel family protein [unclassified Sphingomonas]KQN36965.1 potassium transporter TrkA [Sphingomonas sp. Leaf42]KQT30392.1 potassium transporter TrkA [Sphingomonas sp. Leaf407]